MGLKERRAKNKANRQERRKRFGSGIRNIGSSVVGGVKQAQSQAQALAEQREEKIVRRSERALVIFSELNEQDEDPFFRWLYSFAERQGVSLASSLLNNNYDRIYPVTGPRAMLEALTDTIEQALSDADIDELDLLWHGHGVERKDGARTTYAYSMAPNARNTDGLCDIDEIIVALANLDEERRLRMFYTTACWGAELADAMVDDIGFSCGSGAKAVNTNAALEFPLFLANWKAGRPFGTSVTTALRRSAYQKTDLEVRTRDNSGRFSDTDSRKELFGDVSINIRSNADF
jgi:hypothetical protein